MPSAPLAPGCVLCGVGLCSLVLGGGALGNPCLHSQEERRGRDGVDKLGNRRGVTGADRKEGMDEMSGRGGGRKSGNESLSLRDGGKRVCGCVCSSEASEFM